MVHKRPEELAAHSSDEGFHSERWGDLAVGYTVTDPVDYADFYRDLPGGVCPVRHWGYVVEGRIRVTYPGTEVPDEVVVGGEVYYFAPGHLMAFEERSIVIEFNPADDIDGLTAAVEAARAATADG